jgi:hypothetical protein
MRASLAPLQEAMYKEYRAMLYGAEVSRAWAGFWREMMGGWPVFQPHLGIS